MKLITALYTAMIVAGLGNGVTAYKRYCGTCAYGNTYCDAAGSAHPCWGQMGCGEAFGCPGGCWWEPDNPDYGQWAQC
ncbi:hypothetical protein FQN55_001850 [Onygenales sp. PD_40]|nr:hypothetical protein FQN55_001850 [Onygenales sp. PD_40]KAK2785982.1 hypothetical protein FQN53_007085 [Emmonsiellopsis sp. PD_33]